MQFDVLMLTYIMYPGGSHRPHLRISDRSTPLAYRVVAHPARKECEENSFSPKPFSEANSFKVWFITAAIFLLNRYSPLLVRHPFKSSHIGIVWTGHRSQFVAVNVRLAPNFCWSVSDPLIMTVTHIFPPSSWGDMSRSSKPSISLIHRAKWNPTRIAAQTSLDPHIAPSYDEILAIPHLESSGFAGNCCSVSPFRFTAAISAWARCVL